MKLSDAVVGKTYFVENIELPERIKRRLQMLGMTVNTPVSVLNKRRHGALIIKVRGTRFAIGYGFAKGINLFDGKEI